MKIFDFFNKNKKSQGFQTNITIINNDAETRSPFAVYDGEVVITDSTKPTSSGEFMFLMGLENFFTGVEREILVIVGSMGAATSRQITQLLQKSFPGILQRDVQRRLQKLSRKNFLTRAHFCCTDSSSRSSFSVYIIGYHGRKILLDLDALPKNSLFFKEIPAYKIKRILGATQFLIENDLYPYVRQRSTLLNWKDTYLRVEGILEYNDDTYIVECVRRNVCENGEYTRRANAMEKIVEDYENFGFCRKPKILIVAESSQEIDRIRHFTCRLEQTADVVYGYDTVRVNEFDRNEIAC